MEIIRDLEAAPRGVYTGAIGFITPTATPASASHPPPSDVTGEHISMGVGGGIVADSPRREYEECKLKASFLNTAATAPRLIETLLWEKKNGYPLLNSHLARLSASATQLGFATKPPKHAPRSRESLSAHEETRVRLLLSIDGTISMNRSPNRPTRKSACSNSAHRIDSTDPWRRHKTTRPPSTTANLAHPAPTASMKSSPQRARRSRRRFSISNISFQIGDQLLRRHFRLAHFPECSVSTCLNTRPDLHEETLTVEHLATQTLST